MAEPIRTTTLTWDQVEERREEREFRVNCPHVVEALKDATATRMVIVTLVFAILAGLATYSIIYGLSSAPVDEAFLLTGIFGLPLFATLAVYRVYAFHTTRKKIESDKEGSDSPFLASLLEKERHDAEQMIYHIDNWLYEHPDRDSTSSDAQKTHHTSRIQYVEALRA